MNRAPHIAAPAPGALAGCLYAVAAYGSYGLMPIYIKAVGHVPPWEILAHRIVWSFAFLAALLVLSGGVRRLLPILTSRRHLLTLFLASALNTVNMGAFILAVSIDRVRDSGLGYYIAPLVSVLLGVVFLKERLRPLQALAVLLAALSVLYLTVEIGGAPWIALVVASSWGLYSLIRKVVPVEPLAGLTVEMGLMAPPFLAWLVWLHLEGGGAFGRVDLYTDSLLALAGFTIGLPLLWFISAARRLRLATVGLFQYIGPSLNLVLAVAVYGEPLTREYVLAFVGIWTALVLYTVDSGRAGRIGAPAQSPPT